MRSTEGGWWRGLLSAFASEGAMLKVFQHVSIHLITRKMRVTESMWQRTGSVKGKIMNLLVPRLHDKGTRIPNHVGGG